MFKYVPKLTKDQFFQTNYAAVKALMAADIVELMQNKAKMYHQPSTIGSASHSTLPTSTSNGMISNSQQPTRQLKETLNLAQNVLQTPTLMSNESKEKVIKVFASSKPNIKTNTKESQPMQMACNLNANHEPVHNLIDDRDAVSSISDIESTNSSNNSHNQLLNDLNDKIGNLTLKLNELLERINRIESITNKSETDLSCNSSSAIQQNPHSNLQDVDGLNKKLENLMNRMILLENENLLLKQTINNRSAKQVNNNSNWLCGNSLTNANEMNTFRNNNEDQNESKYETPFHSFLNISSNQTADESNESIQLEQTSIFTKKTPPLQTITTAYRLSNGKENGLIEQGVAYDVEQISGNLDNLSINSNDSTPTMTDEKEKKLSSKFVDSQNDELFRAKQLVIR
jgi:hypothetical protein